MQRIAVHESHIARHERQFDNFVAWQSHGSDNTRGIGSCLPTKGPVVNSPKSMGTPH
jgi:hypothetical protein|eukprot:COSAG02_NODE_4357_length_5457_cov_4.718552_5_plen_57_part_00